MGTCVTLHVPITAVQTNHAKLHHVFSLAIDPVGATTHDIYVVETYIYNQKNKKTKQTYLSLHAQSFIFRRLANPARAPEPIVLHQCFPPVLGAHPPVRPVAVSDLFAGLARTPTAVSFSRPQKTGEDVGIYIGLPVRIRRRYIIYIFSTL